MMRVMMMINVDNDRYDEDLMIVMMMMKRTYIPERQSTEDGSPTWSRETPPCEAAPFVSEPSKLGISLLARLFLTFLSLG